MRFPSVQNLLKSALQTLRRFPLTILFAIIGSIYLIRTNNARFSDAASPDKHDFAHEVMSAYLGMLITLVLTIYGERKKLSIGVSTLLQVLAIAVVAGYYFSMPEHLSITDVLQYILFLLALHLMVAFVPFTAKGEVNGFWQYNKSLFLRILTSGLYSGVIYVGLSLALLAMDKLFSLNIDYKWYGDLWVLVTGIFNTLFFLAGFPKNYEGLESVRDYPRGLKIFTQYVLLPIISVYLLILYAYMFKIIFSRQWPYGWVSYLVLAFSIAGILSLLLIHPIRDEENNKWILSYNRFFYFAIFPLIVLLFLAIERRIADYGITEERYLVVSLACWLAIICAYFLISKTKSIKLIPISLCILILMVSFGPWGAFSVSLRSQMGRLKFFLEKNNLLKADRIVPATNKLSSKDAAEITSITTYIVDAHGYRKLQPLFSENLDSLMNPKNGNAAKYSFEQSNKILALMQVDKVQGFDLDKEYFNYTAVQGKIVTDIRGYDYLISNYELPEFNDADSVKKAFQFGEQELQISVLRPPGKLFVQIPKDSAVSFDLAALVKTINIKENNSSDRISQDSLTLNAENAHLSVKCIVHNISGSSTRDSTAISRLTADILVKVKNSQPLPRY